LSVSVAFGACSSSDDDKPDTPSKFCDRWAAAACSDEVISACQAADGDACEASQSAFCLEQLPATGFSGARASECINAVEAAYADADISSTEIATVLRFAAPCDRLVLGRSVKGEACTSRSDCDTPAGFDCVFKTNSREGSCQLPVSVGPGEDCSAATAVCGAGFHCNGANCIAGESVGDPCTSNEECGLAGFCGVTNVCQARLPVSSACSFDAQCATGLCYTFSPTAQVCTDRVRLSRSEPLCDELR
jgi:hypothetical protein